jgi:hypothetical protein
MQRNNAVWLLRNPFALNVGLRLAAKRLVLAGGRFYRFVAAPELSTI